MNYRGSYKHLLRNSKSAIIAAIEIYNKPNFKYREECFVILLLNAWELLLKSILSKNKYSIFYKKKRNEPYKTLSWNDAFNKSANFFPSRIESFPISKNLDLLSTYRDNAVHFYNQRGFGVIIYALAQTNIINYKDLLFEIFGVDLANEINLSLLPLGTIAPINPIEYISATNKKTPPAIRQFLTELKLAVDETEKAKNDTGRLLTIFNLKLESIKKIEKADAVVGIKGTSGEGDEGPLAIIKTLDPNKSHPLKRKAIVEKIKSTNSEFSPYIFDVICWKYGIKSNPTYCWKAEGGELTKYSNEVISFMNKIEPNETGKILEEYRNHQRQKRTRKKE